MNQIELPELKQLIFKNVDCKNKVEHLIIENHTVDFTWIESNRSYDVIQGKRPLNTPYEFFL